MNEKPDSKPSSSPDQQPDAPTETKKDGDTVLAHINAPSAQKLLTEDELPEHEVHETGDTVLAHLNDPD
jgi:hypothetical protein